MQELVPKAERVAALLMARGQRVAVSESSAGGLVCAALLAVPGASGYFVAGAVTYTELARERLMGIGPDAMAGLRSASPPYALLLANTLRARFGTEWGVAETGAAGPSGNRYGDPAGQTCIAVSGPVERSLTVMTGREDRLPNMRAFAMAALDLLGGALEAQPKAMPS